MEVEGLLIGTLGRPMANRKRELSIAKDGGRHRTTGRVATDLDPAEDAVGNNMVVATEEPKLKVCVRACVRARVCVCVCVLTTHVLL